MFYSFYRQWELDGLALFLFQIITLYTMFGKKHEKKAFISFASISLLSYVVLYYATYLLPFTTRPHLYWYYFFLNFTLSMIISYFLPLGSFSGKFLYILFNLSFIQIYKIAWSPFYDLENIISGKLYGILDVFSIILLLGLLTLFFFMFKGTIPKINNDIGANPYLMAYFPVALLIFYALNLLHVPFVSKYNDAMLAITILPSLPILYNLLITIVNSYEERRLLDRALTETQAQVFRYRYSLELDERIRKERHELKNNYLYIQTLLDEKRYDDIAQYLEKTIGQKMDDISDVSTGNAMIDYIINRKIIEVRKQHIKIYTEVMLPKDLSIDEEKFCTIFLNLFNNAVEACAKTESPDIHIVLKCVKNYLCCEIRNKADQNAILANPDLKTTKDDKENHGLGLKIVNETIAECDGIFSTSMEGNYFVSQFMLPMC
ncbi:MAG: GHKL domain-containing protein [Butyrivibrio sp.]|nr:GHKL domain-containing protein [Butyrivibrio sp.]